MKRYIFIAALAAGVMSFSSCQDELDVEQHGAINTDAFYSNDAECLEGLAALYTTFNSMPSGSNNWYTGEQHFGFAISDDCYTSVAPAATTAAGKKSTSFVSLPAMRRFRVFSKSITPPSIVPTCL